MRHRRDAKSAKFHLNNELVRTRYELWLRESSLRVHFEFVVNLCVLRVFAVKEERSTMSKISHILLKNPVVFPTGTTLIEATQLMKTSKISSVLVSKNNKLAGIISADDVVQSYADGKCDKAVEDVMHSPEIAINSDKWMTDVLEMFRRHKASHLAVVENGKRIGIIRAEDILHTYRFNSDKNL